MARRGATQASWRRRNPDYFIAHRIQRRRLKADEAQAALLPLVLPPPLSQLPWDLAQAERARLERERARLERENARLKDELEAARRAGTRQAAPFSKGTPKRRPRRPGRKTGSAHGRHGQRAVPAVVHETIDVL